MMERDGHNQLGSNALSCEGPINQGCKFSDFFLISDF